MDYSSIKEQTMRKIDFKQLKYYAIAKQLKYKANSVFIRLLRLIIILVITLYIKLCIVIKMINLTDQRRVVGSVD